MESIVPYVNFHTGLRQGQGPGPNFPYCASLVPCTGPGPVPMKCDYTIIVDLEQNWK